MYTIEPNKFKNVRNVLRNISLLLVLTFSFVEAANESFSKSKKELRKIHRDHQITFYCGCKYNYTNKANMIDRDSCGYIPRNEYTKKGNKNKRARRIEWEHVIPAENFGRQFSCWRDGDTSCVTSQGKSYKGRKCCEKTNQQYRIMQADMHNLRPAIGELNADRSNFRFDFEPAEARQYGECKFEVDFKGRKVRIRKEVRGIIARTYLYFHATYNMKLSKQEKLKYEAWNREYPADVWERERNERIAKIQGNKNQFIE